MKLSESGQLRWAAALIVVCGVLAFASGLDGQFVLDDFIAIPHDSQMHHVWPWGPISEVNRWFGVWTFQLNYACGGVSVWGYHVVNLVIHIAAGLTLFGLSRRLLLLGGTPDWVKQRSLWLSLAVALIWMLHPLQTQAVTYVMQRYESLMGLCFMLVLYCTLRGATAPSPTRWYCGAAAIAWLGAGCKEVMVVCPLVLILFDRAFLASSWRNVLRQRGWLHLVVLLSAVWMIWASRTTFAPSEANANAGFGFRGVTPWEYLRSQAGVILYYLRLSFWPDPLILDRGWPIARSPLEIFGCGAVIALLVAAAVVAWIRWPRLAWLGLTFFFVLAPTSSILPIADLAVEHRMYLPLAAVVALVVLAVYALIVRCVRGSQRQGYVLAALAAVVIVGLSIRTTIRNRDYAHPVRLWREVIANNPDHARGYRMLAVFLAEEGNLEEAQRMYGAALARNDRIFQVWIEYGNLFFRLGDFTTALQHYSRATRLNPQSYRAWINIGRCQLILADYAAALDATRRALAVEPSDATANKQLAWLLATVPNESLRNGAEALSLLDRIPQNPRHTDIQWQSTRAAALAEVGRYGEAVLVASRTLAAAEAIHSKRLTELREQLAAYQAHKPWRLQQHAPPAVAAK